MYNECTESSSKLLNVAEASCEDPDQLMKVVEKELKLIKYKAFGKVKEKHSRKALDNIDNLQSKKRQNL